MAYTNKFGKLRGLDNRAVGSPTDQERMPGAGHIKLEDAEAPYRAAGATVSSIARTGDVATVTTGSSHGLVSGDVVRVTGCVEDEYNRDATITVTGATTFTYPVYGPATTPATGTPAYFVHFRSR